MSGWPFAIRPRRWFYDLDFLDDVGDALASSRLPAPNLILELTESSLLIDSAFVQRRLKSLRDLGIRIAIDDFGTGYSSLAYLHSFPVDVLKIDKTFISNLREHSGDGGVMISSIIGLGHNLKLRVVAEGIELPDQLAMLELVGCDLGQGYLLSHPLPAAAVGDYRAHRLTAYT